jgi:hypothetical protein
MIIPGGWDVKIGISASPDYGRLISVGGLVWNKNENAGFYGYDTYPDDSDAALDAMLRWGANKPSGALSLLEVQSESAAAGAGAYGSAFNAGLARLGHTVTLTGFGNKFNGYEPLDYDVLILLDTTLSTTETYQGSAVYNTKVDYILSHGGAILLDNINGRVDRYGLDIQGSPNHASHPATPSQRPFYCDAIGPLLYKLALQTTKIVTAGTNVMGGEATVYACNVAHAQGVIGLWTKPWKPVT